MPQTIRTPGGETMVVLSLDEYEDLVDARDGNFAAWQLATGQLETFSEDEVRAYIAAPSRVAFYRAHRGMTLDALAAAAGIREATLAEMEPGSLAGDEATYTRLAQLLNTKMENLMPDATSSSQRARAAE
jgi:hypothetical protein